MAGYCEGCSLLLYLSDNERIANEILEGELGFRTMHVGTTRIEQEEDLKRMVEMVSIGGFPPCLGELKAISRVVLRAVEPLR